MFDFNDDKNRKFRADIIEKFLKEIEGYCAKRKFDGPDSASLVINIIETALAFFLIRGMELENIMDVMKNAPQRVLRMASEMEDLYEKAEQAKQTH